MSVEAAVKLIIVAGALVGAAVFFITAWSVIDSRRRTTRTLAELKRKFMSTEGIPDMHQPIGAEFIDSLDDFDNFPEETWHKASRGEKYW